MNNCPIHRTMSFESLTTTNCCYLPRVFPVTCAHKLAHTQHCHLQHREETSGNASLVACVSSAFYHSLTTLRERIIRIPRDASGFTGNLRRPLRARLSFVLFFSQFSLACSRRQRRRNQIFLPRRAWPTETRLCLFYPPRVRARRGDDGE